MSRGPELPNVAQLLDIAEDLLGEFYLWASNYFIKEPNSPETVAWHQDSFYWHIDPQLGCNCWIPMSPVDLDSIALAVMPGSHRGWILIDHESYYDDPPMGHLQANFEPFQRHRIPVDQADPSEEVLLPMEPGDGLFFTNYTWHRSEPNCSGRTSAFYAIAYQVRDRAASQ